MNNSIQPTTVNKLMISQNDLKCALRFVSLTFTVLRANEIDRSEIHWKLQLHNVQLRSRRSQQKRFIRFANKSSSPFDSALWHDSSSRNLDCNCENLETLVEKSEKHENNLTLGRTLITYQIDNRSDWREPVCQRGI